MAQARPMPPPIGADVTDLMPAIGEDVTDLMGETPAEAAPAEAASSRAPAPPFLLDPNRSAPAAAVHGIIGAAKGVGNTVFGVGKMLRDYTPVGRISDAIAPGAFDRRPAMLEPSNAQQRTGFAVEQIGEFFTPLGAAGKVKKAAEVAKATLLTQAQSGSPVAAGISGALTAAIPQGRTVQRVGAALSQGAEKSVAQALGATKEWAKSEASKLAPQMLERGVRGSRPAMYEQAQAASQAAGARLGAAYQQAAQAGTTIDGLVIQGELTLARQGLMTTSATGAAIPIAGAEGVIKKLDKLEEFVTQLGDDIPVDKAHKVKTLWDRIVAKAGLYGPKATAKATDNERAWAIREGAGSFRALLNQASPDIAALNREYAFWKGLKDVLKETEKRTQAQGGGLSATIGAGAGGAAGYSSGESLTGALTGAFVGAQGARQLVKLTQSPWWRTSVSAPLKYNLSQALASGNASLATGVLQRMIASLPAQARNTFAQ